MSASITKWLDRIHEGDCLEVMRQLPGESVDLVVTSPPYNLRRGTGGHPRSSWAGYERHADDLALHGNHAGDHRLRLTPE